MGILGTDAALIDNPFRIKYNQAVMGTALIIRPFFVIAERGVACLGPTGRIERQCPLVAVVVVFFELFLDVSLVLFRSRVHQPRTVAFTGSAIVTENDHYKGVIELPDSPDEVDYPPYVVIRLAHESGKDLHLSGEKLLFIIAQRVP